MRREDRDVRRAGRCLRVAAATGLTITLTVLAGRTAPIAAQEEVEALTARCVEAWSAPERACLAAALTVQGLQAGIGLSSSHGSDVPGTGSTVGKRLGSAPRIALDARLGLARAGRPSPDPGGGEEDHLLPSASAGVSVGVFDGFNPMRTLGGFLSIDLRVDAARLFLPDDAGFDGGVWSGGLGARVGLLRESLTLPGVSISVARRWIGEAEREDGESLSPDGISVTTTSLRGTVSKDLLGWGILVGAGWDRYEGEGEIRRNVITTDPIVTPPPGAPQTLPYELTAERTLLFAGLTWHFLILDLSAEGGWASGFDAPGAWTDEAYDPGEGRLFGSAAFRITF